jgi:hypothetical protein
LAYGLSYTITGIGLLFPNIKIQKYHHFVPILYIYPMLYLLIHINHSIYLELFVLLLPISYFHIFISKYPIHSLEGYFFNYLGLLGTAFTVSHDKYYIFNHYTCDQKCKFIIQNLPLLGFILQILVF